MNSTLFNDKRHDSAWMRHCLSLARKAQESGEVPVGAAVVGPSNVLLADSSNAKESLQSPIAHAEVIALHRASQRIQNWRLVNATLYVTLEPCLMCLGALVQARISRVVFGAFDPRAGALQNFSLFQNQMRLNHSFEIESGVCENECATLLKTFFKIKRASKK